MSEKYKLCESVRKCVNTQFIKCDVCMFIKHTSYFNHTLHFESVKAQRFALCRER